MAGLALESFGDLVELTLNKYVKSRYVSLLTDLVDHPAAKQLLKKSRIDAGQGGTQYEWKVRFGTAESYRQIDATTPDSVEHTDDFEPARVPFRKREVWSTWLEEEVDFNMGQEQIIDIAQAKEDGMDFDWIEGFENEFWAFPSATNTKNFFSLPYWCTKNSSVGFNGGIPTGYSAVGALSPTTYSRWNNYSGNYTNVTLDDLIDKARTMADLTGFKPPVANVPDLGAMGDQPRQYFTNQSVAHKFANVADSRNDQLGPDVAKHDGVVTFRNALLNYVPALDADTTGPFYQLNFNVFKVCIKNGWFQKRKILKPYPGKRNQIAVFKDTWGNMACWNRRLLGVLGTGTTYGVTV